MWSLNIFQDAGEYFCLQGTPHPAPPAESCWTNSPCDLICTMCHCEEIYFKMTPNPVYHGKWNFGFPCLYGHRVRASGSGVHAHADDVCTAAFFFPPLWSGKLWLTRYLRRCFSLLWKVTGKSSAWESKLHPCKSVDANPCKPNTIKYGKQSSVNQIFF